MHVFITVGTHEQPFERMMRLAERLAVRGHEVTLQHGAANTPPPGMSAAFEMVEFDTMRRLLSEAEAVISHAGTGSLMLCLMAGKKPVVLPRLAHLGEHVDDHQVQIVQALAEQGLVLPLPEAGVSDEELETLLQDNATRQLLPGGGKLGAFLLQILQEQGVTPFVKPEQIV